jgi:polyvinyl alcohol dehydrogenase (cytochrome)
MRIFIGAVLASSMNRSARFGICVAWAASVAAFGLAARSAAAEPTTALDGAAVYQRICAACHEGGNEKAPRRSTLEMMTVGAIHQALDTGIMKVQAQSLSENERVAVAQYLSQKKLDQASVATEPACHGAAATFTDAPPSWSGWGVDERNSRNIPIKTAGLNKAHLSRLKVGWARAYPNALRARSQPAFAAGAVFVGSHDGTVYALDEKTGCVHWTFRAEAEVRSGIVVGPLSPDRPKALTLFFGDLVGAVYAIDARTGKLHWRVLPDVHPSATITAAPVLHEGRLYVVVAATEVLAADDPNYACCTFRGSVAALDAASGRKIWQTYTIPQPASPQQPNARGVVQLGPSGAPIWASPSLDTKRRRLYVGTGDNYSSPADEHSDSILAVDMDTGAIVWTYQATKGDAWNSACMISKINCPKEDGPDADFGAATIFATTSEGRDLVIAGQKAGVLYALDPDTGAVVWKMQVGRGGMGGGIRFGMALSGDRLFVPTTDSPNDRHYSGPPQPGLYAIDLKTGTLEWSSPGEDTCHGRPQCRIGLSAAITATSGMVLVGARDGWFRIYDADTGQVLWKIDTAHGFAALNGGSATGGAFSGGAGPVVHQGRIYLNSGYGFGSDVPGNLLLMLQAERGTRRR